MILEKIADASPDWLKDYFEGLGKKYSSGKHSAEEVDWPETDPECLKEFLDIPEDERRRMVLGDPMDFCLHPEEVEITKEYLRNEKQLEALYCPLDTHYGPMPATSEQHRQYNREMNRVSRRICIKYEIKRELLTKIVRLNRRDYE